MSNYINSNQYVESFRQTVSGKYFVDKTNIIADLLPYFNIEERFLCITRPRRFGKSIASRMIASFFGKSDSKDLFKNTNIFQNKEVYKHLDKHNVVFIDFSKNVDESSDDYKSYLARLCNGIKQDLVELFELPELNKTDLLSQSFSTVFEKTNQKFVFVFDEWDAPFRFKFMTNQDKDSYLQFLKDLLKDRPYVELAYMTGVLPVKKYSSGSDLNMFMDFSMANQNMFSSYFGFTDNEVDILFEKAKSYISPIFTRDDLRYWYDGYETVNKTKLYNPRSVICALTNNMISNYWTGSGPSDEILNLLKNNVLEIQKPVAQMISGESIPCIINEYSVNNTQLNSKDSIFSAMVVFGLLTTDGTNKIKIPNYEIKQQFESVLRNQKELGYIASLAKRSEEMIEATLNGDEQTVCSILEYAHNTESPIFSYNNENELSAIVNLVYLAANDDFYISREDKAGKGFADFVFISKDNSNPNIILELKVDSTADIAIEQIKQKDYQLRFSKLKNKKVILVGISYSKTTKKHDCKIEFLTK